MKQINCPETVRSSWSHPVADDRVLGYSPNFSQSLTNILAAPHSHIFSVFLKFFNIFSIPQCFSFSRCLKGNVSSFTRIVGLRLLWKQRIDTPCYSVAWIFDDMWILAKQCSHSHINTVPQLWQHFIKFHHQLLQHPLPQQFLQSNAEELPLPGKGMDKRCW